MANPVVTMPPAWARQYIGIPFRLNGRSRDGIDCYGLVCLVSREQFDRDLPFHDDIVVESVRDLAIMESHFSSRLDGWRRVDRPEPGDVVHLYIKRKACHVGLMLTSDWFLHIHEGVNAALGRFDDSEWRRDRHVEGYYRWEGVDAV